MRSALEEARPQKPVRSRQLDYACTSTSPAGPLGSETLGSTGGTPARCPGSGGCACAGAPAAAPAAARSAAASPRTRRTRATRTPPAHAVTCEHAARGPPALHAARLCSGVHCARCAPATPCLPLEGSDRASSDCRLCQHAQAALHPQVACTRMHASTSCRLSHPQQEEQHQHATKLGVQLGAGCWEGARRGPRPCLLLHGEAGLG
jgi:hypothetical protein